MELKYYKLLKTGANIDFFLFSFCIRVQCLGHYQQFILGVTELLNILFVVILQFGELNAGRHVLILQLTYIFVPLFVSVILSTGHEKVCSS